MYESLAPTRRITAISSFAVYIARRVVLNIIKIESIARAIIIAKPSFCVESIIFESLSIASLFWKKFILSIIEFPLTSPAL